MKRDNFRRLQAEWDAKIKAAGFEDIEYRTGGDYLKVHGDEKDPATAERGAARAAYLDDVRSWLRRTKGLKRNDRMIMRLHGDGESELQIASALGMSKSIVHERIDAMRDRMRKGREFAQAMIKARAQGHVVAETCISVWVSGEQADIVRRWAKERATTVSALVRGVLFGGVHHNENAVGAE